MKNKNHSFGSLSDGLSASWPICLGYIPIGIAFGVLAQKAGFTIFETGSMSLMVFAGSSQFIAVSMFSAGAGAFSIITTTFVVNLRHLLMSSSLSLFMGRSGKKKLYAFAYGITDESFAVNISKFRNGNWDINRAMVVNFSANIMWIICSIAGGYGGQFIRPHSFGMDYALIAMFICLLVFQLRGPIYVFTALIAGISAVLFSLCIPGNSYIVIGSVIAAGAGVFIKKIVK
ncbi:MAG: branched-chain amino acid ABC transporter permease [Desulfobacteraceae bacterium]|nr:MAG: branched-chain amino acid ABC transporter permease [Desulfobacteraceae bacterium]